MDMKPVRPHATVISYFMECWSCEQAWWERVVLADHKEEVPCPGCGKDNAL